MNEQRTFLRRGTTRRHAILGAASLFAGISACPWKARGEEGLGISRGAEAIRQERIFLASSKRAYEALTEAQQFDKVMRLSAAMRSMATGTKPAEISREAGGAFSVFGGYVTGLQIELIPNRRIAQVWRSQSWEPGDFSIVKFEFVDQGAGCKIVLEHRGFPDGTAEHLAVGWRENYWEPLQQYLKGLHRNVRTLGHTSASQRYVVERAYTSGKLNSMLRVPFFRRANDFGQSHSYI